MTLHLDRLMNRQTDTQTEKIDRQTDRHTCINMYKLNLFRMSKLKTTP